MILIPFLLIFDFKLSCNIYTFYSNFNIENIASCEEIKVFSWLIAQIVKSPRKKGAIRLAHQ